MTQIGERIAVGMLVSLVGGFLIAVTLVTSHVDRAVIIWLLTVICCGLVVGNTTETFSIRLKHAALPAAVLSATPVLFFYFIVAIALIGNPKTSNPEVSWTGVSVEAFSLVVIVVVQVVWAVCFLASWAFVMISMIASPSLLVGAQKLYKFGPKGINRVKLIVIGVGAVLAAVLSLLSVLGK